MPFAAWAKFVNLPELLQIFHSFADVKTADMLDLPRPALKGGKAEVIATPMSDHQQRIQESLVQRYERIRSGSVDPRDDNALKITTDGRKLALDARLVYGSLPAQPGKLDAVAEQVYAIWQRTQESRATQMLFCDLGVSNKDGQFSVYDALIAKLTEQGIPRQEIAAIGEANSDARKARLFVQVRNGDVRVLLGSTQKMGTGTNVQHRLIALHHVDAPWKPAEVEQREGRILRQGNGHDEVEITRYVTEGSFDAYMWQTLQTKAEFINQVMQGDMTIRRIEDMDDQTLSYAEVKAIASGNPAVLTLAKMEMEAQRLTQLARAHQNEQYRIRQTIKQLGDADLPMLTKRQARLAEDMATLTAHSNGETSILILQDQLISHPKTAQESLRRAVEAGWQMLTERLTHAPRGAFERLTLGTYGGLAIQLGLEKGDGDRLSGTLSLKGQSRTGRSLRGPGSDRLLAYLQELADKLPTLHAETTGELAALHRQMDGLQARQGLPFEHEARLTQINAMRSELQALLQSEAPNPTAPTDTPSPVQDAASQSREQEAAAPSPAPEIDCAARMAALVDAFDALMRDEPAAGKAPAEVQSAAEEAAPNAPTGKRLWTDKVPTSAQHVLPESGVRFASRLPPGNATRR